MRVRDLFYNWSPTPTSRRRRHLWRVVGCVFPPSQNQHPASSLKTHLPFKQIIILFVEYADCAVAPAALLDRRERPEVYSESIKPRTRSHANCEIYIYIYVNHAEGRVWHVGVEQGGWRLVGSFIHKIEYYKLFKRRCVGLLCSLLCCFCWLFSVWFAKKIYTWHLVRWNCARFLPRSFWQAVSGYAAVRFDGIYMHATRSMALV